MKWPPQLDRAEFRQLVASVSDGPLIETAWPCDPIGICATLIESHNVYCREKGWTVEAKFLTPRPPVQHLVELLWNDFGYLQQAVPALKAIEQSLFFAEASAPTPNALHAELGNEDTQFHLIAFHSPLIHFINSAYSKAYVLMHDSRYAEAIPRDKTLFETSEYSDTNLLACLFNDVEVLFNERQLYIPFTPTHAASPYDYCEWVEGTRRFILAHELGHALYRNPARPRKIDALIPGDILGNDIPSWREEYWCDTFAVMSILDAYEGKDLNEVGGDLFECQNALIGVLLLFTIDQIVDAALGNHLVPSRTHPLPKLRRDLVRKVIKSHPTYLHNKFLPDILTAKWRRINSLREFTAGALAPFSFGNLWDWSDFKERLSPFGTKAYRALFDSLSIDLQAFYGGDRELQRQDSDYF